MLTLDNDAFGKQITETLSNGREAVIRVRGTSMYPFIRNYIDLVTLGLPSREHLKKGQIVFFRYGNRYILHRIIREANGIFYIRGDNRRDLACEQVTSEHIIGYVVSVYRNGKTIHCNHWTTRFFALCWIAVTPFRLCLYPALKRLRAIFSKRKKDVPNHVY